MEDTLPVPAPLVQMDLTQLPVSTKPGFLALVNGRWRVQVPLACVVPWLRVFLLEALTLLGFL